MIGSVRRERLSKMENGEWGTENSELTTAREAHQALPSLWVVSSPFSIPNSPL
jgi:hypothetical protein